MEKNSCKLFFRTPPPPLLRGYPTKKQLYAGTRNFFLPPLPRGHVSLSGCNPVQSSSPWEAAMLNKLSTEGFPYTFA